MRTFMPTRGAASIKRVDDVVAVADVRQRHALEAAGVLRDRLEIGERLAGVLQVREGVDDRHGGVLGQRLRCRWCLYVRATIPWTIRERTRATSGAVSRSPRPTSAGAR